MTTSRLRTFCSLHGCTLRVGHREIGFVTIDSGGVVDPRTYSSFSPTGEMLCRADLATLLPAADQFIVIKDGETRTFRRDQFGTLLQSVIAPLAGSR